MDDKVSNEVKDFSTLGGVRRELWPAEKQALVAFFLQESGGAATRAFCFWTVEKKIAMK